MRPESRDCVKKLLLPAAFKASNTAVKSQGERRPRAKLPDGLKTQKMYTYFYLKVISVCGFRMVVLSKIMEHEYFLVSLLNRSGRSHVYSLSTNEEQRKVDS